MPTAPPPSTPPHHRSRAEKRPAGLAHGRIDVVAALLLDLDVAAVVLREHHGVAAPREAVLAVHDVGGVDV